MREGVWLPMVFQDRHTAVLATTLTVPYLWATWSETLSRGQDVIRTEYIETCQIPSLQ